jgi:hypothetical protein
MFRARSAPAPAQLPLAGPCPPSPRVRVYHRLDADHAAGRHKKHTLARDKAVAVGRADRTAGPQLATELHASESGPLYAWALEAL